MTEKDSTGSLKRLQVLDGTALKLVALFCMLIDHIGAGFFPDVLWFRAVGRIAMPVFAFCVAEGFQHTHDRRRYLLRMLLFGLLSEVPFDLFLSGKTVDFSQQNILLTFVWALAGLLCFEQLGTKERDLPRAFAAALVLLAFLAGSLLLRLDYNMTATALVFVFFLLREKADWIRCTAAAAVYVLFRNKGVSWFALAGFLLLFLYNGRRGKGWKGLFYIFYPAHLLLLFLLKNMI